MICFVVLHYVDVDITVKCVESILNLESNKKIIIVDNCSPNNSGIILKEKYLENNNIDVIINDKNLGFANGNNIGYKYCKDKYNPKFIVCLNNDIEFTQHDFIRRIINLYEKEKFAIVGPDVYSTFSGVHQSPKKLKNYTLKEVSREYHRYRFRKNSKIIIPIKCMLKEIVLLKKMIQFLKFNSKGIDFKKEYYNVPLHGSCVIFSEIYIKKRDVAFNINTFMYWEMEILSYEMSRANLKTCYNPSLKVNHHHSISSTKSYKSELKKERFVNKCVFDSLSYFKNMIESDIMEERK